MSFRNCGNKGGDFTKKRKYTLTENAISAILAILISIPICIGAYRSQYRETPRTEPETVPSSVIYTVETREVVEPATEEPTEAEEELIDLGEFRITAYCSCSECCGQWADGITYTGTVATEGRTIAVDPGVIPLGSVVEINGSEYVAEDIGGAIKGNHIDLYFSDHNDALVWGVQDLEVYLVEEAENE